MKTTPLVSLAALPLLAAASPLQQRQTTPAPCNSGYYIIAARGSDDGANGTPGGMTSTANDIASRVPNTIVTGLDYPANLFFFYQNSENQGVAAMRTAVNTRLAQCPDAKIVLMGYSQGAEIVADVLGGQGSGQNPLPDSQVSNIAGAILFGDPSFVPGQSYDAGTAKTHGQYPRAAASLPYMNRFANVMRSYCDDNDFYCASGSFFTGGLQVHTSYASRYEKTAADFIVGLYH